MNCSSCGSPVNVDDKFCSNCGSPIKNQPETCPSCNTMMKSNSNFCPNCGYNLKTQKPKLKLEPAAIQQKDAHTNLKDATPGEVVLKDTGLFPITYLTSSFSSTNGKLLLTNQRLVFKGGKLQGVGGVSVGGIFIPNPDDANKSKQYLNIPLAEITQVEHGWANLTIQAAGKKYKFGGMRETKNWAEEIVKALGADKK